MNSVAFYIRRGVLYSLGGLLSKLIPEQIFRFRYFVVFELKTEFDDQEFSLRADCERCDNTNSVREAEELSRFDHRQFTFPVRATIARVDELAIASFWYAKESFVEKELGIEYQLGPDQRWLFGAMVDKKYRGRKLFPQLLQFTIRELVKEGAMQLYAAVNPLNKASMSVFQSHSSKMIGRAFAIRIFGLAFCISGGNLKARQYFAFNCNKKTIQLELN